MNLGKISVKLLRKIPEKLSKHNNQPIRCLGTKFHSLVQQYLEGKIPDFNEAPPKEVRLFRSAFHVLKRVEACITGEIFSMNPCPFYRDIDSLVIIDGHLTGVEWKTFDKQKPTLASTYDAPLQAVAQLGALNRDKDLVIPGYTTAPPSLHLGTPLPPLTRVKVVVCYTDASPATVHNLDRDTLNAYWTLQKD